MRLCRAGARPSSGATSPRYSATASTRLTSIGGCYEKVSMH